MMEMLQNYINICLRMNSFSATSYMNNKPYCHARRIPLPQALNVHGSLMNTSVEAKLSAHRFGQKEKVHKNHPCDLQPLQLCLRSSCDATSVNFIFILQHENGDHTKNNNNNNKGTYAANSVSQIANESLTHSMSTASGKVCGY